MVLENGIEVVPGKKAVFRYCTFLGSIANLVLEWSIREKVTDDEISVTSDEIGVECSDRIKFEELNLPVDKNAFQTWVKKHFKILSSLMPLNLFCKTLPRELFLQELTDFLFDHRVALAFAHYRDTSSKIISGDMADLVCDVPVQDNQYPCVIDIKAGESLLEMEKTKSKIAGFESPVELFCSDNCLQPSSRLNFVYG